MITILYEELAIVVGIVLFLYLAYGRILSIIDFFKDIKIRRQMNKKYEEKYEKVLEMKKNGEYHEWIDMSVNHPIEGRVTTHVCKKTGYAPEFESFVSLESIDKIIKSKQKEEEFQKYKEKKLEEYSLEYGIKDIESVYEKMITIKKEFHIQKMEDFKKK